MGGIREFGGSFQEGIGTNVGIPEAKRGAGMLQTGGFEKAVVFHPQSVNTKPPNPLLGSKGLQWAPMGANGGKGEKITDARMHRSPVGIL